MTTILGEEAQDRDFARTVVLALAGFAFTAVAGLSVVSGSTNPYLELAVWYVTVSFLSYICSLNLHAYKATRWQSQLAQGLLECGNLALLAAMVAIVQGTTFSTQIKTLVLVVAIVVWLSDHLIRVLIDANYLSDLRRHKTKPGQGKWSLRRWCIPRTLWVPTSRRRSHYRMA